MKYTRSLLAAFALILPLTIWAQDDMYFASSKKAKKEAAAKKEAQKQAQQRATQRYTIDAYPDEPLNITGSNRSVDEYNRRGYSSQRGGQAELVQQPDGRFVMEVPESDSTMVSTRSLIGNSYERGYDEGFIDGEDYALTRRMGRFGYSSVYSSPWYYNYYDPFYYDDLYWGTYDPFYYGYYSYYGWNRPYWGYTYGYYSPYWRGYYGYYGWRNPYYYGGFYGGYYGGWHRGGLITRTRVHTDPNYRSGRVSGGSVRSGIGGRSSSYDRVVSGRNRTTTTTPTRDNSGLYNRSGSRSTTRPTVTQPSSSSSSNRSYSPSVSSSGNRTSGVSSSSSSRTSGFSGGGSRTTGGGGSRSSSGSRGGR
ncbi:MAG: hypothetical protein K6G70_09470 [Bacteroidaceae bacterium]|nr:hypothetical protein [Bacteroidaceae bacterium]